ncbi:Protein CBG19151 [Caenorhabditis briggsae]|uniref:Protein CBG19151 n=1 Tax=Caenorhabditis briggsae TaxID=6238 RepID=A8XUY1_CAEBR|nr:Protein CBG19151 [Caenorhabditis briggsae]CAP36448.2 Protein CBG19151 [Caenorhabditis briggsae]
MSDKYLETDLNVPDFLIHHYYITGCICICLNSFVFYLLLFRKGKLDSFRYYLLAFQTICFLSDFHLSFLMQFVPFFPFIIGGFAIGAFPSFSLLTPHYCMTILSFLVGFQINLLTICFLRKHRVISKVTGKYILSETIYYSIVVSCITIPFTYSIPFHLTGNTQKQKLEIIDRKYPLYRTRFEQLKNFEIYEFTIWMQIFSGMVMAGCVHAVSIVSIYIGETQVVVEESYWTVLDNANSILPSVFIVATIVVPFEGAQVFSWYMLMVMTTHSTINCLVVIFTFPEFRAFVLFWSEEGKRFRKRQMTSGPTSLVTLRTARNAFMNTLH